MEEITVGKRPYKTRKRYFARKEFQLKYIGLIVAVMLLSAAISGYTIYYNSWVILGSKLANIYPQGQLVHLFKTVNIRLAITMVFVVMLCTGIGIVASHRIAGPIFRMIRFLDRVTAGDYGQRLRLRKKDELKDLAEAINRLVEKLDGEKKA